MSEANPPNAARPHGEDFMGEALLLRSRRHAPCRIGDPQTAPRILDGGDTMLRRYASRRNNLAVGILGDVNRAKLLARHVRRSVVLNRGRHRWGGTFRRHSGRNQRRGFVLRALNGNAGRAGSKRRHAHVFGWLQHSRFGGRRRLPLQMYLQRAKRLRQEQESLLERNRHQRQRRL